MPKTTEFTRLTIFGEVNPLYITTLRKGASDRVLPCDMGYKVSLCSVHLLYTRQCLLDLCIMTNLIPTGTTLHYTFTTVYNQVKLGSSHKLTTMIQPVVTQSNRS